MRGIVESLGLLLVVAGVSAIYWPAGIIVAGAGLVFWAQGGSDDVHGDDDSRGA